MKRSEFLKACSILGISIPLSPIIYECASSEVSSNLINSNEKVLIIGAGSAGMSAGYLLAQNLRSVTLLQISEMIILHTGNGYP